MAEKSKTKKSEQDAAEAIKFGAPPDGLSAVIEYVRSKRQ